MRSACGQWEVGDVHLLNNSNYFLSNIYVNSFKNKIHQPVQMHVKQEHEDKTVGGDEGYITEANDLQLENCASNWKAVVSMEKKMWGLTVAMG